MENYIVTVSNQLIRNTSYTLTIHEKRLILCLISRISPKYELNSTSLYTLDIRLYAKLYVLHDKNALADVKKAIDTLPQRKVYLTRPEGFKDLEFNWVSCKPKLIGDGYTLEITWSKEVIPYISKLTRFFTSYPLKDVSCFRSHYALRLYEYILCEIGEKPNDIPYITLENFRFMLGIGENKHNIFSNLNNNVLKPAIKAINRDTDIAVEAIPYKKERKVVGVRFIVVRE